MMTWHSSGLSTNLSWSIMLCSERSQAPSEKSQHAPFGPDTRGELDAKEDNSSSRGTIKEKEEKMETFRSPRIIIMCQGGTMAGRQCNKKRAFLSFIYTVCHLSFILCDLLFILCDLSFILCDHAKISYLYAIPVKIVSIYCLMYYKLT